MIGGYMGKILWVNLSSGEIHDETLDESVYRDYIGGYGIGARILLSRQKAGVDPLGEENTLGFVTGPFDGTSSISAARFMVVTKSPLTGGWGDSNCGGSFGPYLKFAGYDAVFFTGISKKPVYLFIDEGKAELRDATHLWGKDTYQTVDIIEEEAKGAQIMSIGSAGEKLCRIAGIREGKERTAARSGVGAVMGSKKLKAVVVRGTQKVPVANSAEVTRLRSVYFKQIVGLTPDILKVSGTSGFNSFSYASGDAPVKNWGGNVNKDFPDYEPIGNDSMTKLLSERAGCWHCPIRCGARLKAGTEYNYPEGACRPEYETFGAFGSNCANNNAESIVMANHICNLSGIDTMSAGSTIAFAMECYEKGIITKKDTNGLDLTWGNHRAIIALLEQMVRREGFGDVLADGVKVAAERIGKGSEEYAIHCRGQEPALHDPRVLPSYAVTYRFGATPGRHCEGGTQWVEGALLPAGLVPPIPDKYVYSGKGESHRVVNCIANVMDSSGMCMFFFWTFSATYLFEFLNTIRGHSWTLDDFAKTGERIIDIRHAFNLREGKNALREKMPKRLLVAGPEQDGGPIAGVKIDDKTEIDEYLKAMAWDSTTLIPSRERLKSLGLDSVYDEYVFSKKSK
jgi:aldehyde:ferredoxin oxidoreductase